MNYSFRYARWHLMLTIFLSVSISKIYAQIEIIDSLIIELKQVGSDSLKAALNLQLAIEIKSQSLPRALTMLGKH